MSTPPTFEEIETWRANGFDPETIRQARDRRTRFEEGLALILEVEQAFESVKLGNGIGLGEAYALDDHFDEDAVLSAREGDEKDDWRKISGKLLQGVPTYFLDVEGVRFHLPAFICAHLRCQIDTCYLNGVLSKQDELLDSLDEEQQGVLDKYLRHLLSDPDENRPELVYVLKEK